MTHSILLAGTGNARRVATIALVLAVLAMPGAIAQTPASPPPGGDRVRTVVASLDGAVGGVAVDRMGIIYVATFREEVFKVTPDGRVTVFATGLYGASGNAIDSKGRLLQANFYGHSVTRIDRDGGKTTVAEGLNGPVGIAANPDDSFVVCNCSGNTLSQVSADGRMLPFAQSPLFNCPNGITRAPDGTYFVVNYGDARMLRVTADGVVSEFAVLPGGGNGHVAFAGGALYATSFQGHRVYRVTLEGTPTLLAGSGAIGEDDGAALAATFSWPNGIAASPAGDRLFINDFVNRFPPTLEAPPAPKSSLRQVTFASITDLMTGELATGGVEGMTAFYRSWKADPGHASLYTELQVNAFGYALLGASNFEAAIAVLQLNVESYPSSANVHDSLGEAYMKAGRKEEAIASYERSLALNPGNTNAVAMLKILRGGG